MFNNALGTKDTFSGRFGYKNITELWGYVGKTFVEFIELINAINTTYPDQTIIIRPHPSENISIYNDILDKIIGLVESNSNAKKIHVTSHQEYSEHDQLEILSTLKNKFNISDSSETTFNVDSKILGGIKVRIGNKIIDGSVSTKLKKIKQSLLGI